MHSGSSECHGDHGYCGHGYLGPCGLGRPNRVTLNNCNCFGRPLCPHASALTSLFTGLCPHCVYRAPPTAVERSGTHFAAVCAGSAPVPDCVPISGCHACTLSIGCCILSFSDPTQLPLPGVYTFIWFLCRFLVLLTRLCALGTLFWL